MDTKKLAKIIKLTVALELKRQLPELIADIVSTMSERNNEQSQETQNEPMPEFKSAVQETVSHDEQSEIRQLSSNPIINKILNETVGFSSTERGSEPVDTLNFGTSLAPGGIDVLNSVAADQMGRTPNNNSSYGRANKVISNTGLAGLDRIMNRDNSELVKRFATRK